MIVELFIVANALNSLTEANGSTSSFRPFSSSKSSSCPPCPKPSSAIYTKSLQEVSKLRGLGMPVPIVARDPTMAKPVEGAVGFGEALTNLVFPEDWDASNVVVNISPQEQAAFRERERAKQALR